MLKLTVRLNFPFIPTHAAQPIERRTHHQHARQQKHRPPAQCMQRDCCKQVGNDGCKRIGCRRIGNMWRALRYAGGSTSENTLKTGDQISDWNTPFADTSTTSYGSLRSAPSQC